VRRTSHKLAAVLALSGVVTRFTRRSLVGFLHRLKGKLKRTGHHRIVGSLTFSGNGSKLLFSVLAATLIFSATVARGGRFKRTFSGSLDLAGAIRKLTRRLLGGSLASHGTVRKSAGRFLSANLPLSGSIRRHSDRTLAATLAFAAQLAPAGVFRRLLTGSLTFISSEARSIRRLLRGSLAFAGRINRMIGRILTAILDFLGLGGPGAPVSIVLTASMSPRLMLTGSLRSGLAMLGSAAPAFGICATKTAMLEIQSGLSGCPGVYGSPPSAIRNPLLTLSASAAFDIHAQVER
jgi:hypothetical protein